MASWKFEIVEKSTFFVELDTEDEDTAYEMIREMASEGEIALDRPDIYDETETVELL